MDTSYHNNPPGSGQQIQSTNTIPEAPTTDPQVQSTQIATESAPSDTPLLKRETVSVNASMPVVTKTDDQSASLPDPLFFESCQSLVHRYLHKPLPGQTLKPGEIHRPVHGAMHLCRAAMWIPVLLSWRRQAGDREALEFPLDQLPYVMKAALLHDSGREGEGRDTPEWEKTSGEQCEDHLLAMGCPPALAAECKRGITNKDGRYSQNKTLIEKLIHDADCLEIMRVPTCEQFDMKELDVFRDFSAEQDIDSKLYKLASQARKVIASQGDLWGNTEIINSATGFKGDTANNAYSINTKKDFEFADNALLTQIHSLQTCAPELFSLYKQSAGTPPETISLNPLDMKRVDSAMGYSRDKGFAGKYQDHNGKAYYIKEPVNPESARNEVLMARLAAELGLNVPSVKLVRKKGKTFVVSEWLDGLKGGREVFSQAKPEQLARLYLVAAVLGNVDILGYFFNNTLVNPQGELVTVDWGEAGEFGAPNATKRKVDTFTGTVFELDTLLNPEHPLVRTTHKHLDELAVLKNAAGVFQTIRKESIHCAVREMLAKDTSEITRLVELLGPDKPADRQRLKRTLHERLAYLARRFPQCCEQRVTAAEQGAITAGGMHGYSLPVSGKDIDRADLRLYQCQDKNNSPVTECWLKLTPEATRQLADRLGLPLRHNEALSELSDYLYTLKIGVVMTPQWQVNLNRMLQLCDELILFIEQSDGRFTNSTGKQKAEEIRKKLTDIREQVNQVAQSPEGTQISISQSLAGIWELPEGLPIRVTSVLYDRKDTSSLPARQFRYTRAWETGEQHRVDNAHHYKLHPENFLTDKPGIEIDWFSDDLPGNVAMEGVLRLRLKGQQQEVSQSLVSALGQLGIDTRRPDSEAIQEQYIDSLAECCLLDIDMKRDLPETFAPASSSAEQQLQWKSQWLCSQLGWSQIPRWENHHRILAGRCVFYQPQEAGRGTVLPTDVRVKHQMDFYPKTSRDNALIDILHNGSSLCSIVERYRLGSGRRDNASREKDLGTAGAGSIFLRIAKEPVGRQFMLAIKPEVLLRTDLIAFEQDYRGAPAKMSRRLSRSRPCHETWEKHSGRPNNEVLAPFLSLEEVNSVEAPLSQCAISDNLARHMDCAPDGKTLSDFIDNPYTVFNKLCQGPVGGIVRAAGWDQFSQLMLLNPRIMEGKLESLAGLKLSNFNLSPRDLRAVNLTNTRFIDGVFDRCGFSVQQFAQAEFSSVILKSCFIEEGEHLKFDRISSCKFSFDESQGHDSNRDNFRDRIQSTAGLLVASCKQAANDQISGTLEKCNRIGLLDCLTKEVQYAIDQLCASVPNAAACQDFSPPVLTRFFEAAMRSGRFTENDKKIFAHIKNPDSIKTLLTNNQKLFFTPFEQGTLSFKGVQFSNIYWVNIALSGYDFAGAKFSGATFDPTHLQGVDFSNTKMLFCRPEWLNDAQLRQRIMAHPDLLDGTFNGIRDTKSAVTSSSELLEKLLLTLSLKNMPPIDWDNCLPPLLTSPEHCLKVLEKLHLLPVTQNSQWLPLLAEKIVTHSQDNPGFKKNLETTIDAADGGNLSDLVVQIEKLCPNYFSGAIADKVAPIILRHHRRSCIGRKKDPVKDQMLINQVFDLSQRGNMTGALFKDIYVGTPTEQINQAIKTRISEGQKVTIKGFDASGVHIIRLDLSDCHLVDCKFSKGSQRYINSWKGTTFSSSWRLS